MAETLAQAHTSLSTLRVNFPTAEIREVDGRAALIVEADGLREVFTSLCTGGAHTLADLTAVDLSALAGESAPRLRIVYQFRAVQTPFACVQLSADFDPEETTLASVTDLFPGADWQEREVAEMFGVVFAGRASTRALILHSTSSVHPLLKSYPLRGEGKTGNPVLRDPDTAALIAPIPTLRMRLEVVAGRVVRGAPVPGFAHSGIEKLSESLTCMQNMVVCERLNDQSPHAGSLTLALAVESMLGIDVPPRGNYQRVVIAELSRLAGHLAWLSIQTETAGDDKVWRQAMQLRAAVLETMERLRGVGLGTGLLAIGGQTADFPADFTNCGLALARSVRVAVARLQKQLMGNRLWRDLLDGVAALSADEAAEWGLSGPVQRACGTPSDLRRTTPYLAYGELDFEVPVGSNGDSLDRCRVRLEEMVESTGLIERALRSMPSGAWRTDDARVFPASSEQGRERVEVMIRHMQLWTEGHGLRLPAGAACYQATESPNGELGVFVCADGTDRPYRLHLRSPSLMNFQVAGGLVADLSMAQARQALCSLNVVPSEMDR